MEVPMHGFSERLVPIDTIPSVRALEGKPDVHGWGVVTADGSRVGEVTDLVVDTRAMKVRYLDITLDDELAREIAHEPHILVPVGDARVRPAERTVALAGLDRAAVLELPAYIRMPPAPEFEATLRRHFEPGFSGTAHDRDFFESELYDQEQFFAPLQEGWPRG